MTQNFIRIDDEDESLMKLKKAIEETRVVLDVIAANAFGQIQIELADDEIYIIDGAPIEATKETLLSILNCCKRACFSDAFTLLRKFRDDLAQYLFIIFTIQRIEGLSNKELDKYLKDLSDIHSVTEGLNLLYDIMSSNKKKKPHKKAIDAWLANTLSDASKIEERRQYFSASRYINTLTEKDETIKICHETYLKQLWDKNNNELNNYVHQNGTRYYLSNIPKLNRKRREELINDMILTIRETLIIFVSLIILIKPSSIAASNYTDYLDMGMSPPEGSQYLIAPVIQNFIDIDIAGVSQDLKQFLKENNKYDMRIE